MRPLSKQIRLDVVSQLQLGKSIRKVADRLGISKSSVQKIRATMLPDLPKSSGGRPAKLSVQAKRHCVKKVTSGKLSTAVAVAKTFKRDLGCDVSVSTIKRVLYEAGLGSIKKQKKPKLSPKNSKARLAFAKAHQSWTVTDWRKVIFSDETKINRLGSDGCRWAWICEGKLLQDHHVRQTVKHGGGSIMIWGCITANGPGFMCKIDHILDQHFRGMTPT
jgi:transposase